MTTVTDVIAAMERVVAYCERNGIPLMSIPQPTLTKLLAVVKAAIVIRNDSGRFAHIGCVAPNAVCSHCQAFDDALTALGAIGDER